MRRLLFALLLPLLLISQQGAFVHGLEHLPGSVRTSSTQDDRHGPGDRYCEKCFEFAQIGAAAAVTAALSVVFACAFDPIGFRLPIAPAPRTGIPRSRGPPSPL
jgi:hypothetical protein